MGDRLRVRGRIYCCSFCGQAEEEVDYLIVGAAAAICDHCVADSTARIARYHQGRPQRPRPPQQRRRSDDDRA